MKSREFNNFHMIVFLISVRGLAEVNVLNHALSAGPEELLLVEPVRSDAPPEYTNKFTQS